MEIKEIKEQLKQLETINKNITYHISENTNSILFSSNGLVSSHKLSDIDSIKLNNDDSSLEIIFSNGDIISIYPRSD